MILIVLISIFSRNKIEQINWPIPNFNEDPDQNEYYQLFYIDFGLSVFIKSNELNVK